MQVGTFEIDGIFEGEDAGVGFELLDELSDLETFFGLETWKRGIPRLSRLGHNYYYYFYPYSSDSQCLGAHVR